LPTRRDALPPSARSVVTVVGFLVHSEREGASHRLTPVGELDIATAPILEREFDAVHPDLTAEVLVVDLTRLTFMDSSGIHLLLRLNALSEHTDRLRIINGSPAAERTIDISGTRSQLPIISEHCDPPDTAQRPFSA
jgi:anti-sigma B factor antagonist